MDEQLGLVGHVDELYAAVVRCRTPFLPSSPKRIGFPCSR